MSAKRISSQKPSLSASSAWIHDSSSMSLESLARESPVFALYAFMMESFTASSGSIALSMSFAFPIAMVDGSCRNRRAVGDICTVSPAIATTEAALAATDAILTVTFPG